MPLVLALIDFYYTSIMVTQFNVCGLLLAFHS